MRRRLGLLLAGTVSTLLSPLAGCRAHDPAAPIDATPDATSDVIPDAESADAAPSPSLRWEPCYGNLACATLSVPVDDAAPTGETVGLRLLRVAASNPGKRLGSVVVNRGGPGKPMIAELATNLVKYQLGFPTLFERFDVVVFDWRGVGESQPIRATDDAFMESIRKAPFASSSPSDVAKIDEARLSFVSAYQARASASLMMHFGTDAVARDLERVRVALGEETLNYVGFSHGARVGAAYAALHPDRVRSFVLDAPSVWPAELSDSLDDRAKSVRLAFDRFFELCSKSASCAFHGGSPPSDVDHAFDVLRDKIGASASGLPAGSRTLSPFDADMAFFAGLASGDTSGFARDLAQAEAGDGTGLLARADAALGRGANGTYDDSFAAAVAISCHEIPLSSGMSVAGYRAFADGLGPDRKSVELAVKPWSLCVDWPWRATEHVGAADRSTLDGSRARPMLVVASKFDPNAGVEQGQEFARRLGNASKLVVYEGSGHIASMHSACIRSVLTAFMLDPGAPTSSTCPAE